MPLLEPTPVGPGRQVPLHPRTRPAVPVTTQPRVSVAVHHGVVGPAEQRGVRGVGRAVVGPVDQVVRVGPRRRLGAAREGAALVAHPQVPDLGRG